jgi:hypothetical protein
MRTVQTNAVPSEAADLFRRVLYAAALLIMIVVLVATAWKTELEAQARRGLPATARQVSTPAYDPSPQASLDER